MSCELSRYSARKYFGAGMAWCTLGCGEGDRTREEQSMMVCLHTGPVLAVVLETMDGVPVILQRMKSVLSI